MLKLLPGFLPSHFLALFVVSLLVTVSPAQEIVPLEDFAVPAAEPKESEPEEAVPQEATPQTAPEQTTPDASTFEDAMFDEFVFEDAAEAKDDAGAKDDAVIPGNDLLAIPEFENKDIPKGENRNDVAEEKVIAPEKKVETDAEVATDDDVAEDLQPIPLPRSVVDAEADDVPVAARPLVEGAKRPTSWLSRSGAISSNWVRLTSDGKLRGEINVLQPNGSTRGIASTKVAIYRNGKRLREDVTNKSGQFVFKDVKSGVYSLLVSGPDGFAAYGVHALRAKGNAGSGFLPDEDDVGYSRRPHDDFVQFAKANKKVEVPETLRISTAAVPPVSFNQLRSIIQEYGKTLDPTMAPPESLPNNAWDDLIATAIKEKKPGFDEPEGPEMYRGTKELEKNPVNHVPTPSIGNYNVPLRRCENGLMLCGRLVDADPTSGRPTEVSKSTLTLIRDEERVATTEVGVEGKFEFRDLTPGIYSLVAVGEGGFGAISFRAVVKEEPADEKPSEAKQANSKDSNIHLVQYQPDEVIVSETFTPDGCNSCCDTADVNVGMGQFGGGVCVPICGDPACARDAVGFFRPIALAGLIVPAIALAADDPVELGAAPTVASGFQGTAGSFGGGGGGGAALGIGALGVGIAAALADDEPVSPVVP